MRVAGQEPSWWQNIVDRFSNPKMENPQGVVMEYNSPEVERRALSNVELAERLMPGHWEKHGLDAREVVERHGIKWEIEEK